MPEKTALVVGAGPSRLATALGLAKRLGYHVHLVEKHSTFPALGASFGISKNGLKALKEISSGLVQDLEETGIPSFSGGLLFLWYDFRDALVRHVRQLESQITLYLGESIAELRGDEEKVMARFESGLELEADLLIGADGVHSRVRTLLSMPPAVPTGQTIFRGQIRVDDASNPLQHLLDKGMVPIPSRVFKDGIYVLALNFHPKIPGRVSWVVSTRLPVDKDTTPTSLLEGRVEDEAEWAMLQQVFEQSDPSHLKPFGETKVLDFASSLEQCGWSSAEFPRVSLGGDAAHAMRPTDGLGCSMALEDVVVMCRHLESKDKNITQALLGYEGERTPRVLKIHANQKERYQARVEHKEVPPWTQEFKDWVLDGV